MASKNLYPLTVDSMQLTVFRIEVFGVILSAFSLPLHSFYEDSGSPLFQKS
jgi:hypothetical protein